MHSTLVRRLELVALATVFLTAPVAAEPAEGTQAVTQEALIAAARDGIRKMGNYRASLIKTERIKGEVRPAQTIDVLVRSAPRAVRLEFVAGPKSGRRVVWREDFRPGEILAREGGILGLTSLWLDSSGSLARGDTNHAVSEIGFAHVVDVMERDLAKAKAQGGLVVKDQGVDGSGLHRVEVIAPAGAQGLYAQRTRFGFDTNLNVPVEIEVFDARGFLERYQYKNIRVRQTFKQSDFENL